MTDGEYNELADFNNVTGIYVLKYSLKDGKVYVRSFPGREVSVADVAGLEPAAAIDKVLPFLKMSRKLSGKHCRKLLPKKNRSGLFLPEIGAMDGIKTAVGRIPSGKGGKSRFHGERKGAL